MNSFVKVCVISLLALPGLASAADDGKGCDSVNFGADVLAKFPNAARNCRGVMEKNGGVYVHYIAEVVKVEKDVVTVHMLGRDGKATSKVTFVPAEDQRLRIEGKETKYTDLKKGTQVDFYIEHSQWGLYASPEGKRMTILSNEPL